MDLTLSQILTIIAALVGAGGAGAFIQASVKALIDKRSAKVDDDIKVKRVEFEMDLKEKQHKDEESAKAYSLLLESTLARVATAEKSVAQAEKSLERVLQELKETHDRERASAEREKQCMIGQETLRGDIRVLKAEINALREQIGRHRQISQEQDAMNREGIGILSQGKVPVVPLGTKHAIPVDPELLAKYVDPNPANSAAAAIQKATDKIEASTEVIREALPNAVTESK